MKNIYYLGIGILFGITLLRSQVVSWYRIQEMFLFDNFHMYGIIGTAILTARLGLILLARLQLATLENEPISIADKTLNKGTILGGIIFGLGWSIIGSCPGPLYALIGSGAFIYGLGLLAALAGVLVYGFTIGSKKKLKKK